MSPVDRASRQSVAAEPSTVYLVRRYALDILKVNELHRDMPAVRAVRHGRSSASHAASSPFALISPSVRTPQDGRQPVQHVVGPVRLHRDPRLDCYWYTCSM